MAAIGNANLPGSIYQDFHPDSNSESEYTVVNIALVDTDLVNGSTELVPGSHASKLDYRSFVLDGHSRRGVRPPMLRGDMVLRTSTLWHRGTPNRSDAMRPMLALLYTPVRLGVGRLAASELEGPVYFYGNRFGAGLKGRTMEFLAVHAPWFGHVGRILSRAHAEN